METKKFFVLTGLCLVLIFNSCKVYRNVENLRPHESSESRSQTFNTSSLSKLKVGDKIYIQTVSKEILYMHYQMHNEIYLRGNVWKYNRAKLNPSEEKEIKIEEIKELYVHSKSATATIGLILGAGLGFLLIETIVFLNSGTLYF